MFLDYDNDGDPDLFVAAVGRQLLLQNRFVPDGEVRFVDVSLESGVAQSAIGFSAVAADVNNDGWQDIYVCSYNRYGTVMPDSWTGATNGTPNLLLVNQGDGTYRSEAESGAWPIRVGPTRRSSSISIPTAIRTCTSPTISARTRSIATTAAGSAIAPWRWVSSIRVSGWASRSATYDRDGDFDLHVTNMSSTAGKRILANCFTRPSIRCVRAWTSRQDLHTPNGFVSGETMKDT